VQETSSAFPGWTSARWGRTPALPHSSVTIRSVGITASVEMGHTRLLDHLETEETRSIVQMWMNAREAIVLIIYFLVVFANLVTSAIILGEAIIATMSTNAPKAMRVLKDTAAATLMGVMFAMILMSATKGKISAIMGDVLTPQVVFIAPRELPLLF
jgi:hypothetical protein